MIAPTTAYKRHRFPLGRRLVEGLLLERRIVVSGETIRRWASTFGSASARPRGPSAGASSGRHLAPRRSAGGDQGRSPLAVAGDGSARRRARRDRPAPSGQTSRQEAADHAAGAPGLGTAPDRDRQARLLRRGHARGGTRDRALQSRGAEQPRPEPVRAAAKTRTTDAGLSLSRQAAALHLGLLDPLQPLRSSAGKRPALATRFHRLAAFVRRHDVAALGAAT